MFKFYKDLNFRANKINEHEILAFLKKSIYEKNANIFQTRHLGEQNSTRFIEIRHTKLDKAVCIHAVFSHT